MSDQCTSVRVGSSVLKGDLDGKLLVCVRELCSPTCSVHLHFNMNMTRSSKTSLIPLSSKHGPKLRKIANPKAGGVSARVTLRVNRGSKHTHCLLPFHFCLRQRH